MGRHARVVGSGSLVAACLLAFAANAADQPAFGAQLGIGGGARIAPGEERGAVFELVPRAELLFGELRSVGPAVEFRTANFRTAETGVGETCALLDRGSVKCWGYNIMGSLGTGDTNARGKAPGEMGDNLPVVDLGTGRTATMVGAGGDHACALLDDASMKCWGAGVFGGLGLESTSPHGNAPGTMGDNLPAVDVGTGRTVKSIAVGGSHTCAILDDDTLKCWGENGAGQLGLGDKNRRGDQPGEMGDALPAIDLGTGRTAKSVSAGDNHTCRWSMACR